MPLTVFKVLIPFYRADLSPISILHDLVFVDAVPFAVVNWMEKFEGRSPLLMVKLETEHLQRETSSSFDYRYRRVMHQPQPLAA